MLMQRAVIRILSGPLGGYTLLPQGGNISNSSMAFRLDTQEEEEILLNALAGSSHFFWFGHSNGYMIHGNGGETRSQLHYYEVQEKLRNMGCLIKKPANDMSPDRETPYKLVVLNGCNSYSMPWANAFGIDYIVGTNKVSVEDYLNARRDPRAFVGWKDEIDVPSSLTLPFLNSHDAYEEALTLLWWNWVNGETIETCLNAFAEKASENGFDGLDSYAISGCYDLKITDNYIFQ